MHAPLLDRVGTVDGRFYRQLTDASSTEDLVTRWATALKEVPATLTDGSWDVGRVVRNYYECRGGDNREWEPSCTRLRPITEGAAGRTGCRLPIFRATLRPFSTWL